MKIENNAEAIFGFKASDYFLVLSARYGGQDKEWSLNNRISREYAGKDDDIGDAAIYLTEKEAEECKKVGFSYIEL